MTASISFNPAQQSNFAGRFFKSSTGFVQGDALDDPHTRNFLRRAIVDPAVTQPLWGGILIAEKMTKGTGNVGSTDPDKNLENMVSPVTTLTAGQAGTLHGVVVMNQATAMFASAQSRVPMAPAAGAISYYRIGTAARIPLAISDADAATLIAAQLVDTPLYWDTVNLKIVLGAGANIIGPVAFGIEYVQAKGYRIVVYDGVNNVANWNEDGSVVVVRI